VFCLRKYSSLLILSIAWTIEMSVKNYILRFILWKRVLVFYRLFFLQCLKQWKSLRQKNITMFRNASFLIWRSHIVTRHPVTTIVFRGAIIQHVLFVEYEQCSLIKAGKEPRYRPTGFQKVKVPRLHDNAQDGGTVVSIKHRPALPPGNTPGTHFC